MRGAVASDIDNGTALVVGMVDGKIDDIGEVERRPIEAGREVVEILLTIDVDADADVMRALNVGQHVMPVPVVVNPSRRTPGREASPKPARVGIRQIGQIAGCRGLISRSRVRMRRLPH